MALPRDSAKCSVRECVITLTIFFALQLDSLLGRLALLAMAALSLAVLSVTAEQDGYVSPQPTWRDVETPPPRPRPFLRRRALSDEMHYYPTDYAMPRPPWGGVWGMPPVMPGTAETTPPSAVLVGVQGDCTICFEAFLGDAEVAQLPCRHMFCAKCIEPWVARGAATCPLCRTPCRALADVGLPTASPTGVAHGRPLTWIAH